MIIKTIHFVSLEDYAPQLAKNLGIMQRLRLCNGGFLKEVMERNFREIFNYGFASCYLESSNVSIIYKVNSSSKYIVEYYMPMRETCSKIWKKVSFRNNVLCF